MFYLDSREISIINAIHKNHKRLLESQLITHFGVYFELEEHPEKIYSWIEQIEDTRLLANQYLDTIAISTPPSSITELEKDNSWPSYFIQKAKQVLPEKMSSYFSSHSIHDNNLLFNSITAQLFNTALGNSITGVLFNYFSSQFSGKPEDAQKEFAEILNNQQELSNLIKKECGRISIELIKLFQYREMLLLGKISSNAIEPNAREEFIKRAKLTDQKTETINIAIEVYFARELSKVFNSGFQSLYQVHDVEIKGELHSPFLKWINQLSESEKVRMAFTQEIQLKFMMLARDFLLEKMNQPGFLAKKPILTSILAGLIVGPLVAGTLGLIVGVAFLWGIAAVALLGFIVASIPTYFLVTKIPALSYKRTSENREQIKQSITMINNEFLRLTREMSESKATSSEQIEKTKSFEHINKDFFRVIEGEKVARGSISGWLREYAARYRHSKAVEVDLGDEYKEIISQSRKQTQDLIYSINKKELSLLNQWIQGTKCYLSNSTHQEVIKDFELIPKFKEQVLEIVAKLHYIPPSLFKFYCAPLNEGGLDGNESDFAHIKRLAPTDTKTSKDPNPYQYLCDTALNLYKKHEPIFASTLIFRGDPEYRHMLGLSRGQFKTAVTADNINNYLKNSYAFLLSLSQKITPGLGLDPLHQPAIVSDEFILYRMLLLKQLATLASADCKETSSEVKLKITNFIKKNFNQDPKILFDNLANQIFLLNKEVQRSLTFKNSDGVLVTDVELENINQAITLDIIYNSFSFKFIDVLNFYVEEYFHNKEIRPIFAYKGSEQEINPQGTQQFLNIINQYCDETSNFLKVSAHNNALTSTHILECYQHNLSLQVYRTQIRIIKNLKDLDKSNTNLETEQQINYLLKAYTALNAFAKQHAFPLKAQTSSNKLFEFVSSKLNQPEQFKLWIKFIDSKEALVYLMDHLPEQILIPTEQKHLTTSFFKIKVPQQEIGSISPSVTLTG